MKKLLIVLMLLPFTVSGADWCANFAGYRGSVKRKLNVPAGNSSGNYSDTLLNDHIREAAIHVVDLTRAIKITYVDTTIFNMDSLVVDSGCLGIEKAWWSKNDSTKQLTYKPKDEWYQLALGPLISKRGYEQRPSYYDFKPGTGILWLYPTPTKMGDTIKYDSWRKIPSIAAVDNLSLIPQNYRPAVLAYVTYLVADAISDPRTDRFRVEYITRLSALGLKDETVTQ